MREFNDPRAQELIKSSRLIDETLESERCGAAHSSLLIGLVERARFYKDMAEKIESGQASEEEIKFALDKKRKYEK